MGRKRIARGHVQGAESWFSSDFGPRQSERLLLVCSCVEACGAMMKCVALEATIGFAGDDNTVKSAESRSKRDREGWHIVIGRGKTR